MTRFHLSRMSGVRRGAHSGDPPLFMLKFTSIQDAKARREIVVLGQDRTSMSLEGNQAA
jgi:hypothetical protein